MKPEARDAVIMELAAQLRKQGSWCGETHVQKAAYFLQEALGQDLGFDFVLYKHGPYSFDMKDALVDLRANHLVRLETHTPGYGPSLRETEIGSKYRDRFPKSVGAAKGAIERVAGFIGSRNVSQLEGIATALFITRTEERTDVRERAARISELKPHITEEAAMEAVEEVDKFLKEVSGA